MNKFKLIQLLNKLELAVGETVMAKKVKENINELILDVKNEAINYTHSCKSDSEQLTKRKRECECSGMSYKVKCGFKCHK